MNTEFTPEKEVSSVKLIVTLGVAGFLSGLILVATYLFTQPLIATNKAKALEEAVFEVLPRTVRFEAFAAGTHGLRPATADDIDKIYFGYDSLGGSTGVALPGEEGGYQDVISALCGYDPESMLVIGLKILDSKETPGLGDKILKDPDFKANFMALDVQSPIEVVKKGERNAPNQIEAITGATISSNAVGRLVAKTIARWKDPVADYYKQNEIHHANK